MGETRKKKARFLNSADQTISELEPGTGYGR